MRVGFVGTGTMGNPMARCLIDAGHQLTVYDVRRQATTNLCELGASWADSPRAVAESSQAVFMSLPGPSEVEQAVLDPDIGILAGIPPGATIIDTTTNSPTVSRRVSSICRGQGVEMLDSPVSGRPPTMTVMAGGGQAAFNEYRPLLEAMAGNIFYLGESGAGCITKLVTQYLGYSNFVTAIEGLIIGAKAGVDPGMLAQVVPVSAGASRVFDNIPRSVLNGEFVSGGTLDIVAKDLHLACEMAREAQAASAIGNIADNVFQRGQAMGWGQEGFAMAARVLELMAGVELRSEFPQETHGYQQTDPRHPGGPQGEQQG
ncbi:2-hydroxy-3-oxopropionate reductase [Geodia barretti]|uniref:2-hydroxy-3-oxopropionate reductase n=1 Tax=Geodia barretti TaxID=519541 RepID=A0AA35SQP4_GEOBA|nr:2-hydroxy-3-oxopropionate reductase [Geodia barretti]